MRAEPRSSQALSELTSYSLGAVESSSQKAVASCWLAAETVEGPVEGPVEELVGPMETVVVAVGVALDPRRSQAGGTALVAAEPKAVEAEAEKALGPRGLNLPEAAEEGLGWTASKEAVSEAVKGSSLTVVAAAEQRSKEAAAGRVTVANPEEEPEAAGPMEAEILGLAASREAVPVLFAGAAAPMGAEVESPCSAAAAAMEPGAAESALEAGPKLDASAAY